MRFTEHLAIFYFCFTAAAGAKTPTPFLTPPKEAGIEIRGIQYAASQPWPFPHSLMICFTARYASGALQADGVEIEDAQWFSRDNLPTLPRPGATARRLIERWLEG